MADQSDIAKAVGGAIAVGIAGLAGRFFRRARVSGHSDQIAALERKLRHVDLLIGEIMTRQEQIESRMQDRELNADEEKREIRSLRRELREGLGEVLRALHEWRAATTEQRSPGA